MPWIQILDRIINFALAAAVGSSFFILPSIGGQPFYYFFALALLGVSLKLRLTSEYRRSLARLVRQYGAPFFAFALFVGLNILVYFFSNSWKLNVSFLPDYLRTLILFVFFFIVGLQGSENVRNLNWLRWSFFVPLILAPLLLLRDVAYLSGRLPVDIFNGYKLQGFQGDNPTSLAVWLVITFALCAVPIFDGQRRPALRVLYGLLATVTMALTWWTNSRGALIAILFILGSAAYFFYRKQGERLLFGVALSFLILILGFLILPQQGKTTVLVRFYPQYTAELVGMDFQATTRTLLSRMFSGTPTFTAGQTRGEMWAPCPLYVLTHPLGDYGSGKALAGPGRCGLHNSFLQAAWWGGWIAMIVLIWFTIRILRIGLNLTQNSAQHSQALWMTGAFFGIFILAMLNGFVQLKALWVVAGMIVAYQHAYMLPENMEKF